MRAQDYSSHDRRKAAELFEKYRQIYGTTLSKIQIVDKVRDEMKTSVGGVSQKPSRTTIYKWHGILVDAKKRGIPIDKAFASRSSRPRSNSRALQAAEVAAIWAHYHLILETVVPKGRLRLYAIAKQIRQALIQDLSWPPRSIHAIVKTLERLKSKGFTRAEKLELSKAFLPLLKKIYKRKAPPQQLFTEMPSDFALKVIDFVREHKDSFN